MSDCTCPTAFAFEGRYAEDCEIHASYRCQAVEGCTWPAVMSGECVAHEGGRRPRGAV